MEALQRKERKVVTDTKTLKGAPVDATAAARLGWAVLALALMVTIGTWALQFRAAEPPVPLIWPAAGIALALTFRGGWAAALGSGLGAAWLHTRLGIEVPVAAALGVVTGIAGLAGAALLRRMRFDPTFGRVRDALLLLGVGGGLTALVNAAGGTVVMAGLTPAFHETFGLCWVADAMGLILLAPPALALRVPRLTPRQQLEAVAWLLVGVSFVYVVYVGTLSGPVAMAASYAVFPLVLAVALRFGVAITGVIIVAIAGVALACTGLGKGPFAQGSLTANLLSLHSHLAMLGLTGLILASARSERDAADARAREHLGTLARAGRLDAVSSMAAGIAHEINQPLSAVNSYAQAACRMLREGRGADEISDAMERIVAGNERAADIVRRIRGFLGSGSSERQVADLNQLARDGIELVVPEYHRQHVGLSSTRAPRPLHVEVDSVAIRQVVVNLLQNALEALHDTTSENPRVRVLTRKSGDGHWAELVVEDNGPGLPAEGRNDLFEPMVTHRAEGTGLGLAIVRSLITAHDGTIEATDADSGGARFIVRLPIHAAKQEAA